MTSITINKAPSQATETAETNEVSIKKGIEEEMKFKANDTIEEFPTKHKFPRRKLFKIKEVVKLFIFKWLCV
jgi:hypothetical protein